MVFKIKLLFLSFLPTCTILTQTSHCQPIHKPALWDYLLHHKSTEVSLADTTTTLLLSTKKPLRRQDLAQASLEVIQSLDSYHFLIKNTRIESLEELSIPFYPPQKVNHLWKLSPKLRESYFQEVLPKEVKQFVIKTSDLDDFLNGTKTHQIPLKIIQKYTPTNCLIVESTCSTILNQIIHLPSVYFIQNQVQLPNVESRVSTMNLNINRVNYLHHRFPNWNGEGQIISIKEPLYDIEDIDLRSKHISNITQDTQTSPHTTNMATIAAGAGNSSILGKGVAWKARLSSTNLVNFFPNESEYYTSTPAYIQNHSYGRSIENIYDIFAQAYDQSAQETPGLLHVFSVGNQGQEISTEGTYQGISGFANITGSFKMSKNSIAVASVDNFGVSDAFVSKGPAYDGRIKPELSAYSLSGSSDAAALVSGLGTIMHQVYQENNPNNILPSALLKAILIGTAEDIGNIGPDFSSGFGNINARQAIETLQNEHWHEGSISANETQTFTLDIPANSTNLKITIVWNDPAASINSPSALVNDLDMTLNAPSNDQIWQPWVLNSFPHPDSLNRPAQRGQDHLNNVEQITLRTPEAGTYQINIQAFDIPQGPQVYYIVYHWEESNQFLWTFPTQSDPMPFNGERTSIFRWESSYSVNTLGELSVSLDAGQNWQILSDQVNLNQKYYVWNTPDTNTIAQARMKIAQDEYLSDLFSLSSPVDVSVGFNCEDSLLLRWNSIVPAQSYTLYTLGESFMEKQISTQDTFLILQKSQFPEPYFSIEPEWSSGLVSLRNPTIDINLQGVGCYLSGFSVFTLEEGDQQGEGVSLALELGTTYQVQKIDFERQDNNQFISIHSASSLDSSTVRFIDRSPQEGVNTYRARVFFANGESIVSESQFAYFIKELPLFIYPNPVERTRVLNLLSRNFSGEPIRFRLNNLKGQIVLEQEINTQNEGIFLLDVQPGIYWYSLIGNKLYQSGKLLVR